MLFFYATNASIYEYCSSVSNPIVCVRLKRKCIRKCVVHVCQRKQYVNVNKKSFTKSMIRIKISTNDKNKNQYYSTHSNVYVFQRTSYTSSGIRSTTNLPGCTHMIKYSSLLAHIIDLFGFVNFFPMLSRIIFWEK